MAKKIGSAGRFGVRYGRRVRKKVSEVEKKQKSFYSCPSCNVRRAKRVSAGIWECKKCGSKFTGRAYEV
tara:strand:- start:51 stop:257 length:207 start_codon:yes stop_codon:yes gene_type:complete